MTGTLTPFALAVVLGTALGVGVWNVLAVVPRWGAPSLVRRIAPYVRDVSDPRGVTLWHRSPDLPTLFSQVLAHAGTRLSALLGGADAVAHRLEQAGLEQADHSDGVERFRARQLVWALIGVCVGALGVIGLAVTGRLTPIGAAIPPILGLIGVVLCDLRLRAAARRRTTRIEEDLPAMLEFLSLCLSAGEGLLDSLRRVSAVGVGELAGELRVTLLDVGTGSSLSDALAGLQRRLALPVLSRSVDQLVAAIDRGAPLAQVLQAQANDAREHAKRGLIERAGRAEILMLLPLVFLVLPISVVFAVWPGVFMLQLGLS